MMKDKYMVIEVINEKSCKEAKINLKILHEERIVLAENKEKDNDDKLKNLLEIIEQQEKSIKRYDSVQEEFPYEKFSKNYKELLNINKMTNKKLAEYTGISINSLENYSSGKKQSIPQTDKVWKIAKYFGITIEELISGKIQKEGDSEDLELAVKYLEKLISITQKEVQGWVPYQKELHVQSIQELGLSARKRYKEDEINYEVVGEDLWHVGFGVVIRPIKESESGRRGLIVLIDTGMDADDGLRCFDLLFNTLYDSKCSLDRCCEELLDAIYYPSRKLFDSYCSREVVKNFIEKNN